MGDEGQLGDEKRLGEEGQLGGEECVSEEGRLGEEGCLGEEGQLGGRIEGLCQACEKNASKYRCPACDIQTCSLNCVKSHKQSTKCTGKRPRPSQTFLPRSELSTQVLNEDYWLLEEASTLTKLLSRSLPGGNRQRYKALLARCRERNICLQLLPAGMTRAKLNKSHLKENGIQWTIEWIWISETLDHPVNMKLDELKPFIKGTFYSQCLESESISKSLSSLREKHSELPKDEAIKVMLRQEPDADPSMNAITTNRRLWTLHSLETRWTLLLANRTFIEFPTVYIQ